MFNFSTRVLSVNGKKKRRNRNSNFVTFQRDYFRFFFIDSFSVFLFCMVPLKTIHFKIYSKLKHSPLCYETPRWLETFLKSFMVRDYKFSGLFRPLLFSSCWHICVQVVGRSTQNSATIFQSSGKYVMAPYFWYRVIHQIRNIVLKHDLKNHLSS